MTAHFDIAKERFLDLMASGTPVGVAAEIAIIEADAFMSAYSNRVQLAPALAPAPALVGCRACHGSGGKRSAPCKVCGGTGKVRP